MFAAMKIARLLLLPISFLYTLIIWVRNRLFDYHLLKSTRFNQPVIVIGNLLAGGTGKTPMTEYLIKLLSPHYRIATLSRGYGRKTKGFYKVSLSHTASQVGDEPLQFKHKFPAITVAVCENRVMGVKLLLRNHDVVLLDDAYQHRWLTPGLSLLLFDYPSLKKPRWLLPAGPYRDLFSERKRADIIIVTKITSPFTDSMRWEVRQLIGKPTAQPIFLSSLTYSNPYPLQKTENLEHEVLLNGMHILLVTGISHPEPLFQHLKQQAASVEQLRFPDHHPFKEKDIQQIICRFQEIGFANKIIITTEKDAQRLREPSMLRLLTTIPIYYIDVCTVFDEADGRHLAGLIVNFCKQHA
ncbi:lipid-A-disaccharide kinase [bacterium A37T11]|nr:lipid-A-disaccharide kinase [bacterium A37T11]